MTPDDSHYDAKVTVVRKYIEHYEKNMKNNVF